MLDSVLILLPGAILGCGALLVFLVSRVFRLSNRAEALLTVLIMVAALLPLLWNFTRLPSIMEDPGRSEEHHV